MPPPFDNNPASLAGSITVPLEGFKKALPLPVSYTHLTLPTILLV